MKCSWLVSFLFIFSSSVFSQNLTGIWRGNFYAGSGPFREHYKYEVQINQLKNNSLQGVTYSYLTTVFYGKATFEGIWFPQTKSALVKELKLVELKVSGNSDACAMTCDLDYLKDGDGKETLTGTFTSVNASTNSDCGGGTVYLERTQESDFHKEDFLLKKKTDTVASSKKAIPPTQKNTEPKINAPVINNTATINAKKLQSALGVPADGSVGPKTLAALKKRLPGFNDKVDVNNSDQINNLINQIKKSNIFAIKKTPQPKPSNSGKPQPPAIVKQDTIAKTIPSTPSTQDEINNVPQKKVIPVPDVIKTRSNPLVRTIITKSNDIKIELYDNGAIDGDTITVYDNNEVIAWKKGLTDKPITLNVKADENTPVHEFVMVADNLGSIPPNTALMVITTGKERYQLSISSDKQKNAKVIVQYQP